MPPTSPLPCICEKPQAYFTPYVGCNESIIPEAAYCKVQTAFAVGNHYVHVCTAHHTCKNSGRTLNPCYVHVNLGPCRGSRADPRMTCPQAFPRQTRPHSAQRTAPAATLFKPARSHATRHAHSARPCRVSSQSWGILRSSWLWRRERQSAATKFAMETLISFCPDLLWSMINLT